MLPEFPRTLLASLLDATLDEAPSCEHSLTNQEIFQQIKAFLDSRGAYLHKTCRSTADVDGSCGIDGFLIASYALKHTFSRYTHCVIWKDGEIIHDPRGSRRLPLCDVPVSLYDIRRR